ncbi:MAG: ABC transporter ATP-binding protein [Bacteroidetes bacterium]|nr:MAG: ABC transporter ATP-binding protein [Bacteroidota bacterium]
MIQLSNITLNFGAHVIFDSITFTIKPGEKVGLVGRNGSGKSTMLKMLSGELKQNSGQIDVPGSYKIGYLAQTVTFDDTKTPREICSGAFTDVVTIEADLDRVQESLEQSSDPDEQLKLAEEMSTLIERLQLVGATSVSEDVEKVLKGIGFQPVQIDQPVNQLSGGWKMRVELARLLLARPDLLLLDEPTNHLDIESIIWFETHLQQYEGTVMIVSHDQHVLNNVTTRTLEVTPNNLYDFALPYSKAIEAKSELLTIMSAAHSNQQKQIAHKERLINKFKAKAGKSKFAKSLESEIKRMDIIEVDTYSGKDMRIRFTEGIRAGRVVYEAKKLCKSYGDKPVIKDLDLVIERGERIAFVGQNGQGKTTLARILAEIIKVSGGEAITGHNIQLGYYAQDQTERLDGKQTILETLGHHAPGVTIGGQRTILGSFLFEGDEVTKKVSVLSGGERARLSFACMVVFPSNVLILDEPTNHLDIASKNILKNTLQQFEGTLIIVSHDMEFLSGLTTHTLEFRNGKITKHLYGIDEFLKRRKLENLRELERNTPKPSVKPPKPKSGAKENNAQARRLKNLEQQIDKLEKKKSRMADRMGKDGFYLESDAENVVQTYNDLTANIEKKMEEWEQIAEELE